MRLAVCALSAVLLSGCSWLGMGGQNGSFGQAGGAYGASGGAYGADCAQGANFGGGAYGACGAGGGYSVADNGYGQGAGGYGAGAGYGQGFGGYGAGAGYGQGAGGYGAGAGYGQGVGGYGAGAGYGQGVGGYGAGAGYDQGFGGYGAGAGFGATTLGSNAPFGSAVGTGFGGSQFAGGQVVGTQFNNGQFVNGAGVQTVQGAPVYVPQPYPAYYGVPQLRGVSGGFASAALPFGLGLALGTEFGVGGTIKSSKEAGPADGGGGRAAGFDSISYDDAFDNLNTIGGSGEFDVSRNTTLLGKVQYGQANGNTVDTGAFTPGTFDSAGVFTQTPGSVTRDVEGEFSDLKTWTFEGGVRQYVGANPAFRPYVGATGGVVRNNNVTLTQTDTADGSLFNEQELIDSSWNPTASAIVGSEIAVGNRTSIGLESGVRWTDNFSGTDSDRWSIPLTLRGRVAF